ncbi:uncharacterized protein LOC123208364 [Mangifera indica]|uniref:uncharacterized protein LOC123208364 n=1 Tax=Mangifera indica TaxID=29780 RepID=UPI001CFC0A7A|nr:uncharacterized protein LOC123208364 [Mangifera indica]
MEIFRSASDHQIVINCQIQATGVNILTKDYYLNYKMNQVHNLFTHLGVMHERYNDLKDKDIKLTEKERISGLLRSLLDYWTSIISNLVRGKKFKNYWQCVDELQLVEKRRIVMNIRKSTSLSIFPNQRSARHVRYRKHDNNFILDKVTLSIVRDKENVFSQSDWWRSNPYKYEERLINRMPYFKLYKSQAKDGSEVSHNH